jgi:TonB-dependent receptor
MSLLRIIPCRRLDLLTVLTVIVVVAAVLPLPAADAPRAASNATGSIRGRVQNVASGQYLNNARVTVQGTDVVVFTDDSGVYRLPDLPAGRVMLEVFYSGLDPVVMPIDVVGGQTAERNVELTNRAVYGQETTLKLDAFTVSAGRLTEGAALATNEQRFAGNIKNVVATDAFGDITGGNPAEFLQFMPGIAIEDEGQQGNRVGVRGMPNRLTSVSMDGTEIANMPTQAAITSRAVEFKTVSINNASRVEVTKVPTPAMPADSLGGSINMVSKSAFERSGAQLNYRLYTSYNTEMNLAAHKTTTSFEDHDYKVKPGVEFDYTLPVTKRFGLVVTGISTAMTSEHNISNKNYNTTAAVGASPEKPLMNSFQKTEGSKYLYRKSASLRADWQVTPQSVLSFTGQASDYLDQNGNINMTFNAGANATPSVASGVPLTFGPDFTHGATGRGTISQAGIMHHVYGSMVAAGTRYRFDNGQWHVDGSVTGSRSRSWRRYTEAGHFRSVSMTYKDPLRLDLEAINPSRPGAMRGYDNNNQPVDIFDLRNYRLTGADSQPRMDARTDMLVADANVRRELSLFSLPFSLQVGGRERRRTIDSRRENYAYTYRSPDADLSPARYPAVGFTQHDNGYGQLPFASPVLTYRAWQQNPNLFFQTPAQIVASEQYRRTNSEFIRENVDALYLQTDWRLLQNRLRILTGVRREWTKHEGTGPLFDRNAVFVRTAGGDFARDAAGQRIRRPDAGAVGSLEELKLTRIERGSRNERSYAGNYPSLHVTYNLLENLQVRAAYARTYGRPDFNSIVPNTDIREADGVTETRNVIVVRNPALRPWTADNYDLSLEYYTKQGGMLSVAVFRKDIEDFFGSRVTVATPELLQEFGLDPQYLGWDVNSTFNAGSARVTGIEVGVSNSLQPLGAWGRHFTVFANATKLHLVGGPDADFQEFIPETANWGVTFSRKPFTMLARWNYRGKQRLAAATGMGPGGYNYNDYRVGLDMNAAYQYNRRLSFFINARNVLNQNRVQLGYAPMTPDYAKRSLITVFGTQIEIGVKGTF